MFLSATSKHTHKHNDSVHLWETDITKNRRGSRLREIQVVEIDAKSNLNTRSCSGNERFLHTKSINWAHTFRHVAQRLGLNKNMDKAFFITLTSSGSVMSVASKTEHLSMMNNGSDVDNRHHNKPWCMGTIMLYYYICSSGNCICTTIHSKTFLRDDTALIIFKRQT